MVTEPLAALPPLSLPFRAAVDEAAAAAGSMFWEAMSADVTVTAGETNGWSVRQTGKQRDKDTGSQTAGTLLLLQQLNVSGTADQYFPANPTPSDSNTVTALSYPVKSVD